MAKKFRSYEFNNETIYVEEASRIKIKWWQFKDKLETIANYIPIINLLIAIRRTFHEKD